MPYTIKSGDNLWNIWQAHGQGVSWSEFLALNSQFDNPSLIFPGQVVNLPGDAAAEPAAPAPSAPSPAPAPAAAPAPSAVGPVPVAPGITAQQWEAALSLQRETALALQAADDERVRLQAERDADARRLQEAQLAANPADFVAYELYKRSLVEQGFEPEGAIRSDVDIQDLFGTALDLNKGTSVGTGQFGVGIPSTQSISRSELQGLSKTAIDTLSSFLRGGVDTGEGEFQGINPADFFTELEEGLVPVLPGQRTQFVF